MGRLGASAADETRRPLSSDRREFLRWHPPGRATSLLRRLKDCTPPDAALSGSLDGQEPHLLITLQLEDPMTDIKGLHHNAYRCRDSEETRVWYEEFLGLPLVSAFEIQGGEALHTFFQMKDG